VAYDGLTVEVGFEADGVDAATGVGQEGRIAE
jgi:hypothetical protein